ncbi:hypothetical protein H206_01787 [Candidatus Electrothrix aarhusensis]|uniref:Uncharacterized protein n=1 Tax=Candidatus Electrothrix aarhusensis TaxID=1859131 RepID=A0A3S3RPF1_9BACT|nr:hypothetical protein H206_01787 [Candidatus Electrothrix aarhusensis]
MNAFINTAHKIAQHGLVLCGSGNLSYRKDEHHMLSLRKWLLAFQS